MLSPGVGVADDEDRDEGQRLDEAHDELVREGDRPGVEEHDLDIEDDEEKGDEVVAEVELDPAIALRLDAALVGVELHGVGRVGPESQQAEGERGSEGGGRKQHSGPKGGAGTPELG